MLIGGGKHKLISIVIPTYRQALTIKENVTFIQRTLQALSLPYEMIIVVDGAVDNSVEKLRTLRSRRIRILNYKINQGKGYAVRKGMLAAKGDLIGFIDGGMDIDPGGLAMLLNHMIWYDADVIVGSKLHPVSQVSYPLWRRILSWGYRTLIRLLFGLRLSDTQVGLKIFKRKVVRDVFPRILVKKFAFDIEALAVAHAMGYTRIFDAPIKLDFKLNTISTKNLFPTIFWMLWDTFAVFYRLKILRYYSRIGKK